MFICMLCVFISVLVVQLFWKVIVVWFLVNWCRVVLQLVCRQLVCIIFCFISVCRCVKMVVLFVLFSCRVLLVMWVCQLGILVVIWLVKLQLKGLLFSMLGKLFGSVSGIRLVLCSVVLVVRKDLKLVGGVVMLVCLNMLWLQQISVVVMFEGMLQCCLFGEVYLCCRIFSMLFQVWVLLMLVSKFWFVRVVVYGLVLIEMMLGRLLVVVCGLRFFLMELLIMNCRLICILGCLSEKVLVM